MWIIRGLYQTLDQISFNIYIWFSDKQLSKEDNTFSRTYFSRWIKYNFMSKTLKNLSYLNNSHKSKYYIKNVQFMQRRLYTFQRAMHFNCLSFGNLPPREKCPRLWSAPAATRCLDHQTEPTAWCCCGTVSGCLCVPHSFGTRRSGTCSCSSRQSARGCTAGLWRLLYHRNYRSRRTRRNHFLDK